MNTNIKKKGRSAIAIVLSLAMILTTATFPVSIAKADTPTISATLNVKIQPNEKIGETWEDLDEDLIEPGIQITLPATTTFVFVKQGKEDNVLWTLEDLIPGELDAIKAELTGEADSHDPSWTFKVGEGDHEITSSNGQVYTYSIWKNLEDGTFTFTFDASKVSHFYSGYTEQLETKYSIEVTKDVTLNGDETELITTSFYVALFDGPADDGGEMIGEKQEFEYEDGAYSKLTFEVVDPDATYYIYEVDEDGNVLTPGVDIEGYYLTSITNQGVEVDEVPALVEITNNFVTRDPDTIPISVNKKLVGADLSAGDFAFTLVRTNKDGEPLVEEEPQIQTNNEDGLVKFENLTFKEEGTYYYIVYENIPDASDLEWMNGMVYDDHVYKIEIEVKKDDDKFLAAITEVTGSSTFINTQEYGQISVTKVIDDSESTETVDGTFYAGLFTMVEDEYVLVKYRDEKAIVSIMVEDSLVLGDPKVFERLDLNETYYIFETNKDGVIIEIDDKDGYIIPGSKIGWYAIAYDGNEFDGTEIELTPTTPTGSATITNYFTDFEAGFDPAIEVEKIVKQNGTVVESTLTFYVGLFRNPALTDRIAFKPLTTTTKASFAYDTDGTPLETNVIYYIAETDKDGKPLTGTAKELGFQISINSVTNNNAEVVLVEEGTTVTIVNDFKKNEEFPLTGDNSNMNLWLFLAMLGVAGAIAPFAFRKKEVAND